MSLSDSSAVIIHCSGSGCRARARAIRLCNWQAGKPKNFPFSRAISAIHQQQREQQQQQQHQQLQTRKVASSISTFNSFQPFFSQLTSFWTVFDFSAVTAVSAAATFGYYCSTPVGRVNPLSNVAVSNGSIKWATCCVRHHSRVNGKERGNGLAVVVGGLMQCNGHCTNTVLWPPLANLWVYTTTAVVSLSEFFPFQGETLCLTFDIDHKFSFAVKACLHWRKTEWSCKVSQKKF